MKIISKDQATRFKNSESCIAIEYPIGDKDVNGAIIKLTGRYPDKGRVVNLKCKELAYVIEGSGRITIEGQDSNLKEGDVVLIEPGEKYFWDWVLTIFVSCTPDWYPEQHKEVE
ncbi:MAG: hypothetical protein A3C82_02555 [Candidatus Wildermuthbacteria bacterium RIFCSPHIGHO2_02_FULL_47_12]|uniref:(S)-ureidoglycine aminohydrolase cupin domain-containing protein n=1 Tax=Candidatus Wildermuthbacteria bacterium RIFCSPHIGHO2_02_FULL_47_12 TaxID=1802451 RepID=A0A1G2R2R2_9BACT|nr:MAG: hypothetical protein A3C82_02555 [Candidatus Wildermuthbacteria bacterium RIFCSPHIGHO2_02_FULL_47_12]